MKYSFVLLTWNRYKFLEQSLPALIASIENPDDCEIVVMDNGSTDKTPEILRGYQEKSFIRVITRDKNYGLPAYKKLFKLAQGDYIVVVDDDVLEFPKCVDRIFTEYFQRFPDYGFLALNVVQNEYTNGAKPGPESYIADTRDGKTVERGPTGGWCACFRKSNYQKLWLPLLIYPLSMKRPEDGFISRNFKRKLNLESGIIRDHSCFHACGPHYARVYGHLDREIQKYAESGLSSFVDEYKGYLDKPVK
jgi:glycosyltransferase involved in cell wall biosynthesis